MLAKISQKMPTHADFDLNISLQALTDNLLLTVICRFAKHKSKENCTGPDIDECNYLKVVFSIRDFLVEILDI